MKQHLIAELQKVEEFFNASTRCLNEGDSVFRPVEGMMTAAQQVAHVARTVDWFVDAIKSPTGFDMNFAAHWEESNSVTSLSDARAWFARSIRNAIGVIEGLTEEQLRAPLPEGPVMGGAPKLAIVSGIADHTAHHRGALTVYSRLVGKTPDMPYAG